VPVSGSVRPRAARSDPVKTLASTLASPGTADAAAAFVTCSRPRTRVPLAEPTRYVRRYPGELPAPSGLLPQVTTPVTIINVCAPGPAPAVDR
jgi:hypothetical protein